MFRRFSNDGAPLTGEILATKEGNGLPKVGSQRTPAVAVLPGERFVLAWEDSSAPADSNGSGVVVLQFDADLTPRAIRQVNSDNGFIVGHQRKPQLVASGTLQAPWVLVLYKHSKLNKQNPIH